MTTNYFRLTSSSPHIPFHQILPAVVRFHPDLILVSAGFDAHKKDDINYHYIGIAEKEYEWLTDQIVQVANRCVQGPICAVLHTQPM